jgi:hypothetical protein
MAATPGFLIIDARSDGLPDAPGYYQAFPLEQSPLGEISLSGNCTTAMTNSSLDTALGEMLKAGAKAVVVLVCHAYSGGLLLPIATGGRTAFAVKDNLQTIDKVIAAESEVAKIRNLPSKTAQEQQTVLDRWTKLLNDLQPGAVQGQFTPQQAQALYAKWLDMVAKKLEFANRAALLRLIEKVLKVRNLKLSRLELRACNIGKDTASMEAVRKFFGVDHLTAPTAGTFYLSLISVLTMAVRVAPRGRVALHGNVRRGGAAGAGVRGTGRTPGPLGRAQGMENVETPGHGFRCPWHVAGGRPKSLPLPEFGMGISFHVHVVLEHAGDGVQPGEVGRRCGVIDGAPIAYRATAYKLSDASGLPGSHPSIRRQHHSLALSIQGAVGPRFRPIRSDLKRFEPQQLPGAFE